MPHRDLKPGAMFLCELRVCYEEGKAKTARAGPGEITVRGFAQGKVPLRMGKNPTKAEIFSIR